MAKPCLYAKRWWTEDLAELRKNFTAIKNIVRRYRRQDYLDQILEIIALNTKHKFFKTIKRQKKRHWEDFLNDFNNIW